MVLGPSLIARSGVFGRGVQATGRVIPDATNVFGPIIPYGWRDLRSDAICSRRTGITRFSIDARLRRAGRPARQAAHIWTFVDLPFARLDQRSGFSKPLGGAAVFNEWPGRTQVDRVQVMDQRSSVREPTRQDRGRAGRHQLVHLGVARIFVLSCRIRRASELCASPHPADGAPVGVSNPLNLWPGHH